jgi:hypothetical protein
MLTNVSAAVDLGQLGVKVLGSVHTIKPAIAAIEILACRYLGGIRRQSFLGLEFRGLCCAAIDTLLHGRALVYAGIADA